MAQVTAAMVKELRNKTGAGMMDCKKALVENDGDIDASADWLRSKSLATAIKKADRIAADGLVALVVEGSRGAVVEINAETDFVARNDQFQDFARTVAQLVLENGDNLEALNAMAYPGGEGTVSDVLVKMIATIGENMSIRRAHVVAMEDGIVGSYVHGQIAPGLGRIGVLVGLSGNGEAAAMEELAKQISMHVAASAPQAVDRDSLDAEMVERERAILADQARESGKPENIVEKMVEGRLRKYFQDVVLCEQTWVMDSDLTVNKVLAQTAADSSAPLVISEFMRFALGEGIDVGDGPDFAAEVAGMAS